eukprot:1536664-Pleurochrysis_carterae.AAC.1
MAERAWLGRKGEKRRTADCGLRPPAWEKPGARGACSSALQRAICSTNGTHLCRLLAKQG